MIPSTLLKTVLLASLVPILLACFEPEVVETTSTRPTEPSTSIVANSVTAVEQSPVSTPSTMASTTNSHGADLSHPVSTNPVSTNSLQGMSATVYKDPNCGCCAEWIDYAQKAGMQTTVEQPSDLSAIKDTYGVPADMRSCHLAVTKSGYVFEGHVPAKFIAQFIANPPENAIGLSVPGMPVGSPGMEYQDKFMAYDVYQMSKDGSSSVYASVDSPNQQL